MCTVTTDSYVLAGLASGGLAPIPFVYAYDESGTSYRFYIYSIHTTPIATNAVYMFCYLRDGTYVPVYIGKAEDLRSRLVRHERMAEALSLKAKHLLVHTPGIPDRINYLNAERRLIAYYDPDLNVQHRT